MVMVSVISALGAEITVIGRIVTNNNIILGFEGALVSFEGSSSHTDTTDIGGYFTISIPGNQSYTYMVSATGFSDTIGLLETSNSDIIMGDIILNEVAYPPNSVTATVGSSTVMNINWRAHSFSQSSFLDDFEGYEDFSLEFGDWTTHDMDMSATYGYTGVTYPNYQSPAAYMIFNPEATIPPIVTMSAHSGSRFATSISTNIPPNNDWLISPLVQGGGIFSFWAKSLTSEYGLERFKVGVSTSGTYPQSFNIISGPSYIQAPTEWTQYSYDLSAYSNQDIYVGIQCVSYDAYMFMVDDVYLSGITRKEIGNTSPARSSDRIIQGYKVWRLLAGNENNETEWTALTPVTITSLSYQDASWGSQASGIYKWAVKAVYSNNLLSPPAFSNSIVWGVPGTLGGRITDFDTGQAIEGACIEAGVNSCSSNAQGYYSMSVYSGTHTVNVFKNGYLPHSQANIIINPLQTTTLNIRLVSDRVPPGNFSALVQEQDVHLSWLAPIISRNATTEMRQSGRPKDELRLAHNGYRIYRNETMIAQINEPSAVSYIDSSLSQGTYIYAITALYDTGESIPQSLTVSIANTSIPLLIDEGFEDYPDFSLSMGNWNLVDWDEAPTVGIDGYSYLNSGSPMAYMIFNPSQTIPPLQDVYPYEGSKFAAAFCPTYRAGLDWLITPFIQLDDTARVKFTAMSYSTLLHYGCFRLAVSTLEDLEWMLFEEISGGGSILIPRTWTTFEYDLSAYSNQQVYIGLQCLSADISAVFIDDFKVYSGGLPHFSINPSSHNFGVQYVENQYEQEFVINNSGSDGLEISSITLSGNEMFSIINSPEMPCTLDAGQSMSFTILYHPTESGGHTDTINIIDNTNASPHQINISGFAYPVSNSDNLNPPAHTGLLGNHPNPFNPQTTIQYSIKDIGHVTIDIYNLKGQMLRRLVNTVKNPGTYSVVWDGKDSQSQDLATGVYLYQMHCGDHHDSGKMMMMK
jgi:hypothetical protein